MKWTSGDLFKVKEDGCFSGRAIVGMVGIVTYVDQNGSGGGVSFTCSDGPVTQSCGDFTHFMTPLGEMGRTWNGGQKLWRRSGAYREPRAGECFVSRGWRGENLTGGYMRPTDIPSWKVSNASSIRQHGSRRFILTEVPKKKETVMAKDTVQKKGGFIRGYKAGDPVTIRSNAGKDMVLVGDNPGYMESSMSAMKGVRMVVGRATDRANCYWLAGDKHNYTYNGGWLIPWVDAVKGARDIIAGDRVADTIHPEMTGTVDKVDTRGIYVLYDGNVRKGLGYHPLFVHLSESELVLLADQTPPVGNVTNVTTKEAGTMEKMFPIGSRVSRINRQDTDAHPIGTKALVMGYAPPCVKVVLERDDYEDVRSVIMRAWRPESMALRGTDILDKPLTSKPSTLPPLTVNDLWKLVDGYEDGINLRVECYACGCDAVQGAVYFRSEVGKGTVFYHEGSSEAIATITKGTIAFEEDVEGNIFRA